MTKKQITGTMGAKPDGSQRIFLVGNADYTATKEWLAAQSKAPATGDYLVTDDQGNVTLQTEEQVTAKAEAPAETEAQKKTDGGQGSENGSSFSPLPEYVANPFTIQAGKITAIENDVVTLENGAVITVPGISVTNRIQVGDCWVSHEGETGPGGFLSAADFAKMFTLKE